MPSPAPARLSDYSVDVWFLYGSFSYGLEARVCAYGAATLTLEVRLREDDAAAEVAAFLESVLDDPRGLLRTELRVYGPEGRALDGGDGDADGDDDGAGDGDEEPVRLTTDVAPAWADGAAPSHVLRLRFAGVVPAAPGDGERWRLLVGRVWPNMTSA